MNATDPPPEPRGPEPPPERPRVDLKDILRGAQEIILLHAGEEYHLRITRNGKLILTK